MHGVREHERTQKRKAQEQREQGKPPASGPRAFGYDQKHTVVIAEEEAVLREAMTRLFAGESLRSMCFDLEGRGVRSTAGNGMRAHLFQRTLTSPTLAGMRGHEGRLYHGNWPAIFSSDEHERLKLLLNRRMGAPRNSPARKYLLSEFIRCGRCKQRMTGHAQNERRRYVCPSNPGSGNCGSMSVRAEPLEDTVREMLIAAVDHESVKTALDARNEPQDDGLLKAIRRDEESLETLSKDFYADQLISREEFLAARAELNRRLEGNRTRMASQTRASAVGKFAGESALLAASWDSSSLEYGVRSPFTAADSIRIKWPSPDEAEENRGAERMDLGQIARALNQQT
jgi:site-specific DNA recombinase